VSEGSLSWRAWRHLRRRRTLLWATALATLAALLCFVPLFNLLAYEFSAAIALLASLAAAHLGSVFGRTAPAGPVARSYLCAFAAHLLLLVPPLALITLNALRVRNCNYGEGLAFFALLPVASVACATATGLLSAHMIDRPALATAASLSVVVASLALGLLRMYFDPPVYAYDPFLGYFPGALYDEEVTVPSALLWFRAMNGAVILALLLLASQRPLRALLAIASAVFLYAQGPRLGFRNTATDIEQALGGRLETPHFVILFRDDGRTRDLGAIERDHEFRFSQLAEALGVRPSEKIRSYLFPSAAEKRRLMGAGRTFVAKPWRSEIYLQEGEPPQPALKHELVHVFGAAVAKGPLGLPRTLDMGLVEGLAVALDWPSDEGLDPHQQARALRDQGLAPPLESLFGKGFLGVAPARAYTLAGSFVRHLLDRHGAAALRRAYRSGDFLATYGRPLSGLEAEWLDTVSRTALDARDRAALNERFRRPAIWRRVCAHEVATLSREADGLRASHPKRAALLLRRVVEFDPGEPAHLLGLADALREAGELVEARRTAERALSHPAASAPLRHRALSTMGDLSWRAMDMAAARDAYQRAAREPAPEGDRRLLDLKIQALSAEEMVRDRLFDFLLGGQQGRRDAFIDGVVLGRLATETPGLGLAPYLLGRQLWQRGRFERAAAELRTACELPLPGVDFRRECHRLLALAAWRSGDLLSAEAAARVLLRPRGEGGDPDFARDMLERFAWERRGGRV